MSYKVDFADIKARVSIEQAAKLLKLDLHQEKQQLRGCCPACGDTDPRKLVLTPSKNIFFCFAAMKGGSCLDLVCHITGLELVEAAQFLDPQERAAPSSTSPTQRQEKQKEKSAPTKPFDPSSFGAKLAYSEEVKALGISEEDAERFTIGFYRGRVYLPMRDSNGSIAGFIGYSSEGLKMPPLWLPQATNVVPIRRGA